MEPPGCPAEGEITEVESLVEEALGSPAEGEITEVASVKGKRKRDCSFREAMQNPKDEIKIRLSKLISELRSKPKSDTLGLSRRVISDGLTAKELSSLLTQAIGNSGRVSKLFHFIDRFRRSTHRCSTKTNVTANDHNVAMCRGCSNAAYDAMKDTQDTCPLFDLTSTIGVVLNLLLTGEIEPVFDYRLSDQTGAKKKGGAQVQGPECILAQTLLPGLPVSTTDKYNRVTWATLVECLHGEFKLQTQQRSRCNQKDLRRFPWTRALKQIDHGTDSTDMVTALHLSTVEPPPELASGTKCAFCHLEPPEGHFQAVGKKGELPLTLPPDSKLEEPTDSRYRCASQSLYRTHCMTCGARVHSCSMCAGLVLKSEELMVLASVFGTNAAKMIDAVLTKMNMTAKCVACQDIEVKYAQIVAFDARALPKRIVDFFTGELTALMKKAGTMPDDMRRAVVLRSGHRYFIGFVKTSEVSAKEVVIIPACLHLERSWFEDSKRWDQLARLSRTFNRNAMLLHYALAAIVSVLQRLLLLEMREKGTNTAAQVLQFLAKLLPQTSLTSPKWPKSGDAVGFANFVTRALNVQGVPLSDKDAKVEEALKGYLERVFTYLRSVQLTMDLTSEAAQTLKEVWQWAKELLAQRLNCDHVNCRSDVDIDRLIPGVPLTCDHSFEARVHGVDQCTHCRPVSDDADETKSEKHPHLEALRKLSGENKRLTRESRRLEHIHETLVAELKEVMAKLEENSKQCLETDAALKENASDALELWNDIMDS